MRRNAEVEKQLHVNSLSPGRSAIVVNCRTPANRGSSDEVHKSRSVPLACKGLGLLGGSEGLLGLGGVFRFSVALSPQALRSR